MLISLSRLRVIIAVVTTAAFLITATAAGAKPSPGHSGDKSKDVCPAVPAGFARCLAKVVTDDAGAAVTAALPFGYGPADIQSAYGLPSGGGAGKTVAIVDAFDLPTAESNLATYRSTYGLPPCTTANGCFRKVDQNGGTLYPVADVGWGQEIALDLDAVSAACPNCKILLVEASSASFINLGIAQNYAAAHADVVSDSYGGLEFSSETSSTYASPYNHPGVPISVASGDDGYGAEFPSSLNTVTSVGGTSLSRSGNARGWTESAWSGTGSGCSSYVPKPSWQHDAGCSRRTSTDVSAVADPNTGIAVYDTYGSPGWMVFGGTSLATPIIASTYALAGDAGAFSSGSYFYNFPGRLFDVTSGSNGSCGGSYLCTAGVGFDGPTGLGTPNLAGSSAAQAPAVTTAAAGGVSTTGATLNGTVNPNGQATTYHFEYGTTAAYGNSTPNTSAGSGTSAQAVSAAISGLSPSTTYHFRIVATNTTGTTNGSDLSFTTPATPPPPQAPTVLTGAAGGVSNTTATINATVNPNSQATTYHFEYGTTTAYGNSTADTSAGSGSGAQAVSATLNGLTPSTVYHYRVVATNLTGTSNGSDATFTTAANPTGPAAPTVVTGAATAITTSGATINGTINPNGQTTSYYFEYGTTTSYGLFGGKGSAGSGTTPVAVSAVLTGLVSGTTYHYRLVAANATGTTFGADVTFTAGSTGPPPPQAPTVTTAAAGSVTTTGATLNGTVNPNGQATTYHFEYGTTAAYGNSTPNTSAGSGTSAQAVSAAISGLSPSTTYHFRIVATNTTGTTNGSDLTFTTAAVPPPPQPPAATTLAATAIGTTGATLNASVNPNGQSTSYHFEYGTTAAYGSSTPDTSAGSGTGAQAVAAAIGGLSPSTLYHFRVVATNINGTTNGTDLTFTTAAVPPAPAVSTLAASGIGTTTATLNANVNPQGQSTTYHFEYGTTTAYGNSTPNTGAGSGTSAQAVSAAISGLAPSTLYHFRVVATNATGTTNGTDLTFTTQATPPPPPPGTATPNSIVVRTGTISGGNAASLAADDDVFLDLASASLSGTQVSDFYGVMNNVPNSLTTLQLTYVGRATSSCTGVLSIYNFALGSWQSLTKTFQSTTETSTILSLSGTLADYVSGTSGNGDVQVGVACYGSSTPLTLRSDQLRIAWTT